MFHGMVFCKEIRTAVARTIVAMEQGYVTAAFFRHRMYERYRQWEEQEQLDRMLDEGDTYFLPHHKDFQEQATEIGQNILPSWASCIA